MSVDLSITELEAVTVNQTEGILRLRGQVRNEEDRPVPILLSQVAYRLDDHSGRPVTIQVDGLDQFRERTLRPDEQAGFAMTLHASRIKIGQPYRLSASIPGLTGRDSVAFRFRLVDPR